MSVMWLGGSKIKKSHGDKYRGFSRFQFWDERLVPIKWYMQAVKKKWAPPILFSNIKNFIHIIREYI